MRLIDILRIMLGVTVLGGTLAITGCSFSSSPSSISPSAISNVTSNTPSNIPSDTTSDTAQISTISSTQSPTKLPPIDVQIVQSFRDDNGNLNVKVRLTAKKSLPTEKLDVTLKGLAEGNIIDEQRVLIKDALGKETIRAGESALVLFEMKDAGLTEYQVASRWGDEALLRQPKIQEIASSERSGSRGRLSDEDAPTTPLLPILARKGVEKSETQCETPPCDELLRAVVDLANPNIKALQEVQLALELVWLNDGDKPRIRAPHEPVAAEEELVSLKDLAIAPQKSKTIRLKVDRPIPSLAGGHFEPVVRLLASSIKYAD